MGIRVLLHKHTEYNEYVCAVYGYYEDCKTPRTPEDKLQ